jgi:hypothetical protein
MSVIEFSTELGNISAREEVAHGLRIIKAALRNLLLQLLPGLGEQDDSIAHLQLSCVAFCFRDVIIY